MKTNFPERIICLTEETTELLYALGEEDRIVGISEFTKRPGIAKETKPVVGSFIDANYELIEQLKPDLIVTFSDVQANVTKKLIQNGYNVIANNQHTIREIFNMMLLVGSIVGKGKEVQKLTAAIEKKMDSIRAKSAKMKARPKVYFEEWDDPMIAGNTFVSELIEIAGGDDIFPEMRGKRKAKDRMTVAPEVMMRNPDIIIASWCGEKVGMDSFMKRNDWSSTNAGINQRMFDIDSSVILQPGIAALTEGLDQIRIIISNFKEK